MKVHEKYMFRCIQLAKNGLGTTYPNPLVGSVIVYNDEIFGEGWHYQAGLPHAEVNAIDAVADKAKLKQATLYVSLEPCSHFGKTPPCADLIIAKGIKKVVVGSTDPNPKVAGRGIKKMMEAGIDVIVGVLNEECEELNKRFFTFQKKKRPFIVLKWAETLDGFMAPSGTKRTEQQPFWITHNYSRQLVHKLRAEEQAILVGTNTVLQDNPGLTTRDWFGSSPIRIIIDKNLKLPETASVFNEAAKTIVLTAAEKISTENVIYRKIDFNNLPKEMCSVLFNEAVQSVIIEGGSKTHQSFIDAGLWDEAFIFKGNVIFREGIEAPQLSGKLISEKTIEGDKILHFKNNHE